MTEQVCCRGRSCPKCRNWTAFANDFRKWLDGGYDKRAKPKK